MFRESKGELPATWQWPGLWSLNLGAVVLLWHVLFARSFEIWLSGYHLFITGAIAWCFVAAERWIYFYQLRPEAASTLNGDPAEQRIRMIRICLLLLGGVVLLAVVQARVREIAGLLIWTSLGGAYLVALQSNPRRTLELFPREMALALFLAGAATLFIWARAAFPQARYLLPAMLYVLLLFCHLRLTGSWTRSLAPVASDSAASMEKEFQLIARMIAGFLVVLAFAFPFVTDDRAMLSPVVSVGVSALILLLLECWSASLARPAARVLADVALLSPVVPLAIGV